MPNRPVNPPVNDPDGASKVAAELLRGLLDSERTLRQLAEAAAAAARSALVELGQDLLGDFKEVHKMQLPNMSEDDIRKLIRQRVQQLMTRQAARASTPTTAPTTVREIATPVAPATRAVPTLTRPAVAAPALTSAPSEPPDTGNWSPAPMASHAETPAFTVPPSGSKPAETPTDPSTEDADNADESNTAIALPDFVPFTPAFEPVAPAVTWPTWFSEWMQQRDTDGFAKDFTILQILGRTGEAYRSVVARTAAAQLQLQSGRSGTIGRAIDRLIEVGWLIREQVQWKTTRPQLLALNAQGLDAYRLLWGQTPAPQVLSQMLARHKSAPHVHLILETQRLLENAGYTVERFPAGYETAGGTVCPDLVALLDGKTLYIEVEVHTAKNSPDRRSKWLRYWELTEGQFYIAVANKTAGRSIMSELRHWGLTSHHLLDVWLLEVSRIEPGNGWDIWQHFTL